MATKTVLLLALAFVSHVTAHGFVKELQADGKKCIGYNPNYHPDSLAGCMYKVPTTTDNGYVDFRYYGTRDMICHKGAQSDKYTLKVKAGSTITGTFTAWPESHHGPIIDSLSKCDGDCRQADLTKQNFDVVSRSGLLRPRAGVPDGTFISDTATGYWALDDFREKGSIVKFTVPKCLKPGNYIWRHEMIALHSAMVEAKEQGAQHYPYCINIEVSGDGTQELIGGSSPANWYSRSDPGITLNIFRNPTKYTIPGPDVSFTCGVNDQSTNTDAGDTSLPTTTATTLAAASTTTLAAASTTTLAADSTSTTLAADSTSTTLAAATHPPVSESPDEPTTTTAPGSPYQNVTASPTPSATPTSILSGYGSIGNTDNTDNTGNTDNTDNTGSTDNNSGSPISKTGTPEKTSTPTSKINAPDKTGAPAPKSYNTDNADNTGNTDVVVTPSSSTIVADLIKQLQTGLDELRKALKIPSSKVKRRHSREVVLDA